MKCIDSDLFGVFATVEYRAVWYWISDLLMMLMTRKFNTINHNLETKRHSIIRWYSLFMHVITDSIKEIVSRKWELIQREFHSLLVFVVSAGKKTNRFFNFCALDERWYFSRMQTKRQPVHRIKIQSMTQQVIRNLRMRPTHWKSRAAIRSTVVAVNAMILKNIKLSSKETCIATTKTATTMRTTMKKTMNLQTMKMVSWDGMRKPRW